MTTQVLNRIEETISHLSPEEQLRLIEQLVHRLREGLEGSGKIEQNTFESQLAAMASDPEIIAELRGMGREFSVTEADGLQGR